MMDDDCIIILDSDDEDSNKQVEDKKPVKPPEKSKAVTTVPEAEQTQSINGEAAAHEEKATTTNGHPKYTNGQPTATNGQPTDTRELPEATSKQPQAVPKVNNNGIVDDNVDSAAKALDDMLEYCLVIAPTDTEMAQVAEKARRRFNNCQQKFKKSDYLLSLIKEQHQNIVKKKEKKYEYLKTVSDELSYHKDRKRVNPVCEPSPDCKKVCVSGDPQPGPSAASTSALSKHEKELEYDRQRKYRKLEKSYERVKKIIRKLEEAEVDWDDENDSVYIQEYRYKSRLVKIYNKMKEYSEEPFGTLRAAKQKITFNRTPFLLLNKKVEEFINRGNSLKPPDFCDVYKFIQNVSEELKLSLDPIELRRIAEDAFLAVGKQLKNQRITELKTNLGCLLESEATDPAEIDKELECKLKQNQELYKHREDEVMAEFTRKAEEQKLQPQEVGSNDEEDDSEPDKSDTEAEESDDVSENGEVSESDEEQLDKPNSESAMVYNLSDNDDDNDNDGTKELRLRLSSESDKSESEQPPKSPEKDVVKQEEKFIHPVSPPRISPLSSQKSEILIDSSQEITPKPSSSFEDVFTRHITTTPQSEIPEETEIKTKTFAEAFTQHLLTSSVVIVKESAKPKKSIEEELNFLSDSTSSSPVPSLKRKHELSNLTKLVKSERLVVSPKLVLCDILPETSLISTQITIKKVQRARKTFPKPNIDIKPMQTPEITSSSNIDSDDDCIILD